MNFRIFWIGFGILALLIVTGGITYKSFIQPTSKTVVQGGGRYVDVKISDPCTVPLGGCATYRLAFKACWTGNRENLKDIKK